ncbi:MAG: DUF2304 domain-containing protein [Acidimicrobiia bacterium]|jgi:hypothetical protein
MSTGAKQALILALGGLALAGVIVVLVRRRLITTRYALGWLAIAVVGILGALLTGLVSDIGDLAGMTPTAVFLAVATVVLLAITIQLTISVSGLQSQVRDLAESHALLEAWLRDDSDGRHDA